MAKKSTKQDSSKQPTSSKNWEVVKFDSERNGGDMFSLQLEQADDTADDTVIIGVFDDENPVELEGLSTEEQKTLAGCEAAIDRNRAAFMETALALCIIRKQRLYREKFKTFEEYCQTRHGFGRKYGYRLAKAGQLLTEMGPIGDTALTSESAARQLLKAPKAKRLEVLEKAKAEAGGKSVTAAKIKEAVVAVTEADHEEDNEPAEESVLVRPNFHASSDQPPLTTHREMAKWAETGYNIHSDSTRREQVGEIFSRLMLELKRHAQAESLTQQASGQTKVIATDLRLPDEERRAA